MSDKPSIFPLLQPQPFSDYGFEPQFDYDLVLEEVRKHKAGPGPRSADLRFKLQKPISKCDSSRKIKKTKKRWWRSALLFFKRGPSAAVMGGRRRGVGSISSPVYSTDSRSGLSTLVKEEVGIPYISLGSHRGSATSAGPIYLVT